MKKKIMIKDKNMSKKKARPRIKFLFAKKLINIFDLVHSVSSSSSE
jgi:hypothetical protein